MNINRVEGVPFTQIANTALRDTRLSFRARGILAMVLSHSGEWKAPARWIVQQGTEGRDAIQKALNELTEYGYRTVEHQSTGTEIRSVTVWRHTPKVADSSYTGILYHEDPVSLETRASSEDYLSEEHSQKTIEEPRPVADANEPPEGRGGEVVVVSELTPAQIANQITRGFYDLHKGAVNFNALRGVVTKLVKAGYDADRIAKALTVTEGRGAPLTVDVLRQELEGRRKQGGRPSTTNILMELADQTAADQLKEIGEA